MPQPPRSFEHQDTEKKTDEALRLEARAHLGDTPSLQLVAELLAKLHALDLRWWTPEARRSRWSATDRMRWYRSRADLRQTITTTLSGLAPRAARKKTPEFQGALIDSAIDEGDVDARAFEDAFEPADLVIYGPADDFWHAFVERMPWGEDTPAHQELCAWLFDALLADRSSIEGLYRKPILTALDARTSIDGRVWHTRMPLEIRVAIDEARFQKERQRPGEPFHAESDLSIAVSATIAASIPLKDLAPVFSTAERQMGFARPARAAAAEIKAGEPARAGAAEIKAGEPARPKAGEAVASANRASASAPPPARTSIAPPPASIAPPPASIAPPPPSMAPPPPAVAAATRSVPPPSPSRPPPGFPASAPPAEVKAAPKRAESASAPAVEAKGVKPEPAKASPSGRASIVTIPEGLHDIPGEEERTNPWDIPSDVNAPADLRDDGDASKRGGPGKG